MNFYYTKSGNKVTNYSWEEHREKQRLIEEKKFKTTKVNSKEDGIRYFSL